MWSPNELLKIEKQRDILSYITLQFFHFKKVPLEHCPLVRVLFFCSLAYIIGKSAKEGQNEAKNLYRSVIVVGCYHFISAIWLFD